MPLEAKNKNFFKNPHIAEFELGDLKFELHYEIAKNYPITSAAMSKLAETEIKDDESRKKGKDDYCLSIDKLMDAFDTFIKEYSGGKKKTGDMNNYDFSRPCDLTIRLLWALRHTWTHGGGVIDKQCKADYERIITSSDGIEPIVKLPKTITVGSSFTLKFKEYHMIKKCIFEYIKPKVDLKEYKTLATRSFHCDPQITRMVTIVRINKRILVLDYLKAVEFGFTLKDGIIFNSPEGSKYYPSRSEIVLPDGRAFPALMFSLQEYDKLKRNPNIVNKLPI
jgi:hypothetical protein